MPDATMTLQEILRTEYNYGVIGFEKGREDCPAFTNMTRTLFGAMLVQKRFAEQGLETKIFDRSISEPPGLNPYFEDEL